MELLKRKRANTGIIEHQKEKHLQSKYTSFASRIEY